MTHRPLSVAGSVVCALVALAGDAFGDERPEAPSFQRDVMAVMSKAGCNMGVCHGNKYGKGGFRLSLRGEDPAGDFEVLTRDLSGRRINGVEVEQSLLLQKPLMRVAHEGGRRFTDDSPEYKLLYQWIAAGMPADSRDLPPIAQLTVEPLEAVFVEPADSIKLRIRVQFADGEKRDVTRLATYEPSSQKISVGADGLVRASGLGEATVVVRYLDRQVPVRLAFIAARPDFVWSNPPEANFVDRHVFDKLQKLKINPSPVCDDSVFVRRVYLDLVGVLPTAAEARSFVEYTASDKRARLVEELLERPEFADCWALKWSDLLRNEEKTLDRKGVQNFHAWIRESIAHNKPLDQFARELIASRGSTYSAPASNYWRAMRDPQMRAESTAQIFLGLRLQCAKCHNHPFDRWTQEDYYCWSNLFARVDYRVLENNRRDKNDKHEFDGEQIVFMARKGEVKDPRTDQPAPPRFLKAGAEALPADADRLLALSGWLPTAENRLFVESQVNRIWFHLVGRGIVDPIDDFRATNPPSNPALLEALARDFVEHRFDMKHVIRTIANSHTYQLSGVIDDTNRDDETNFSHAIERRLPAEVLLDAISSVTDVPLRFSGYPAGVRAGELPGVKAFRDRDVAVVKAERFLKYFGKPARLQSCECERTSESTLSQTFQLVNGDLINDLLSRTDNRLGHLLNSARPDADILNELYWSALCRAPTDEEQNAALAYLQQEGDRRAGLEDVLWGLLNSYEFLLRR